MILFRDMHNLPMYVWCLLAYLVYVGIRSSRAAPIHLPLLSAVLAILVLFRLPTLLLGGVATLLSYLGGAAVGYGLCLSLFNREGVKVLENRWHVQLPATQSLLWVFVGFFAFRYIFGYLTFGNEALILAYQPVALFCDGLLSGYLLGLVGLMYGFVQKAKKQKHSH